MLVISVADGCKNSVGEHALYGVQQISVYFVFFWSFSFVPSGQQDNSVPLRPLTKSRLDALNGVYVQTSKQIVGWTLLYVAVVGDQGGGADGVANDAGVLGSGEALHLGVDSVGDFRDVGACSELGLERHQVGSQAGDVGRGHRGARKGLGASVGLGVNAQDVDAGGEDVAEGAKVGEARLPVVALVNGTHGDGARGRGGGRELGVRVLVASGGDGDDTSGADVVDGLVDGSGGGTTKRHVHDGLAAQSLGLGVACNEGHATDDASVGATAVGVKDLDTDDVGLLGDTDVLASNGASDVRAVAVLIRVLLREREM